MDCIFCKIIAGEIPSKQVYEDEHVLAFYDLAPIAPVHVLVIPKEHLSDVAAVTPGNSACAARIFEAIPEIAAKLGLENGYRVAANVGADAGQTVGHLHFHLMGGAPLGKMA